MDPVRRPQHSQSNVASAAVRQMDYPHVDKRGGTEASDAFRKLHLNQAKLSYTSKRLSPDYVAPVRSYSHETSFLNLDQPAESPRQQQRKRRPSSGRRPSDASSSQYSAQSPFPAPSKPLPSLPPHALSTPPCSPHEETSDRSSYGTHHLSLSSLTVSDAEVASIDSSIRTPPPTNNRFAQIPEEFYEQSKGRPRAVYHEVAPTVQVGCSKLLDCGDKKKTGIFQLDISPSSSTIASKHGNNVIKFWSVSDGEVQQAIKFSAYTEAQRRSRNYFIRSHAILSESSNIVAIATKLGTTLEIWNWASKKKIQSFSEADRWAAGRFVLNNTGWGTLVTYKEDGAVIDVYAATSHKKPFAKIRTIELKKSGLPVLPSLPELALSATGPLLIAASGPRPPRKGQPPPEKETILAAWEIQDDGTLSSQPYKVATPWEHAEINTALPLSVATYGSVVVSLWIPADYEMAPHPLAEGGYKLYPVKVTHQYVLVWDLTADTTKTIPIPTSVACISPNCRYVAYCDSTGVGHGARGRMAMIDAMTGQEVWCWPDPGALSLDNSDMGSQLYDLGSVTDLCFSADGSMLLVGDSDGRCGVYDVRERS